jgi:hypothetical protein
VQVVGITQLHGQNEQQQTLAEQRALS